MKDLKERDVAREREAWPVPIFSSMLQLLHSFYSTCVTHCELYIESKLSRRFFYTYIYLLRICISSFLGPSLVATRRFPLLSIAFHLHWASYGFLVADRNPVGVYGKLSCSPSDQSPQTVAAEISVPCTSLCRSLKKKQEAQQFQPILSAVRQSWI